MRDEALWRYDVDVWMKAESGICDLHLPHVAVAEWEPVGLVSAMSEKPKSALEILDIELQFSVVLIGVASERDEGIGASDDGIHASAEIDGFLASAERTQAVSAEHGSVVENAIGRLINDGVAAALVQLVGDVVVVEGVGGSSQLPGY